MQKIKEAVIFFHQGKALLKIPNVGNRLRQGAVFIIPVGVKHSLEIIQNFKATAIMALVSEINSNQ